MEAAEMGAEGTVEVEREAEGPVAAQVSPVVVAMVWVMRVAASMAEERMEVPVVGVAREEEAWVVASSGKVVQVAVSLVEAARAAAA